MDRTGPQLISAIQDFRRARARAKIEQILARLTGTSAELLNYEEVRQKLKGTHTTSLGLQNIPIDAIIGSVGRYADFTRSFLPRQDGDERRWARVETAMTDMEGLPPVEVYRHQWGAAGSQDVGDVGAQAARAGIQTQGRGYAPQRLLHLGGVLEAVFQRRGQGPIDDVGQRRVDVGVHFGRRRNHAAYHIPRMQN